MSEPFEAMSGPCLRVSDQEFPDQQCVRRNVGRTRTCGMTDTPCVSARRMATNGTAMQADALFTLSPRYP